MGPQVTWESYFMSGKTCCASCAAQERSFDAPTVPDALPPLSGENSWLVPVQFQGQPLRVELPVAWDGYEEDNISTFYIDVQLIINGDHLVDMKRLEPPFDASADFPIRFQVPVDEFNIPGFATLHYRVFLDSGNSANSDPVRIEIDHRAPNGDNPGGPLKFPDDLPAEGITEAWLALNGDRLEVTVPRWPDMEREDRVLFYWGTPFDAEPVAVLTITSSHLVPGTPITFAYSGDILREKGNGLMNGYYVLSDRAGNRNGRSPVVPIEVIDLPVVPGDFPAPVVPLADIDKLIDLEDARTGVAVHINEIGDSAAGDILETWWNGRQLRTITLPANPQWPQIVPVDWAVLSADGFAGPVPTNVQYRWRRGIAPGKDSPMIGFAVDLSVAGPDPEGPDPINPKLDLLVVKGATGDNILVGPDMGNDALVVVDLYASPRAGELLELHWGDHPQVAATYRVLSTDQPGQQIEFKVPWTIIDSVGNNPQLPVFYWVSNGVNRQRSRDTHVRVAVRPVEGLEPVTIPDANINNYIACEQEPWNGVRVRIPGNAGLLAAGDLIEMSWQLSLGGTGEQPITEHVYFPPHELSATEAVEGVILLMDRFTDLILPIQLQSGSANVGYRLTKLDGTPGIAPIKRLRLDLTVPGCSRPCDGSGICDDPPEE